MLFDVDHGEHLAVTVDEDPGSDLKAAYAEGALNPGSYDNVRDLLYERWGLVPVLFTKTGLPSTSW